MKIKVTLFSLICLCAGQASAQKLDTAAINASYRHAHRIHEDSADYAQQLCLDILHKSAQAAYLKGQGDACLTLGAISRNKNKLRESYRYLNQALKFRRTIGDSNRVAAVFINQAINLFQESRYDSAIATVLYAIKIVEELLEPDYCVLGSEYLLLSNIYDEYLEPDDALKYARRSLLAYTKTGSSERIGKAAYALGNRFLDQGILDSSLIYYDLAYNNFMSSTKDLDFLANIQINKGVIYTKKCNFSRAGELFKEAEELLDRRGPDADYFHLYLNKGDWLIAQNDRAGGLTMLKKALPEDVSELSFLEQQFIYEDMAAAYAALHMTDSAYYFQKEAYAVRDSIYNEHKRKEFIRFQAERYKKESAQQEAIAQQQASRARQFLLTAGLLAVIAVILIIAYFQRRKSFRIISRQRETLHKQAVDELIQASELKFLTASIEGGEAAKQHLSRELHDRLGSEMVTLTWRYDSAFESLDPTHPLKAQIGGMNKQLKQLYEEMRTISHQNGSSILERVGLIPVLTELFDDLNASGKIKAELEISGMTERLPFQYELNVLRIVQELVSNVLKYAKASSLTVQLSQFSDNINLMIEDDGIGFKTDDPEAKQGTGLLSVEKRITTLNGFLQVEPRPGAGTTFIIDIPLPAEARSV